MVGTLPVHDQALAPVGAADHENSLRGNLPCCLIELRQLGPSLVGDLAVGRLRLPGLHRLRPLAGLVGIGRLVYEHLAELDVMEELEGRQLKCPTTDVGVEERKKRRSRAYDVPLACMAWTAYLGSYCVAESSGLSVPQSSYR